MSSRDDEASEPLLLNSNAGRPTLDTDSAQSLPVDGNDDEAINLAAVERQLLRKLDKRMAILLLIYILNYIDRNNASAARLKGFEHDLHLKEGQFASILSVLYIGYIIMQVPSNMFLDYVGKPSIYLPACMLLWGLFSALTGFTSSFIGALATRFCVGFVEAAFFPGALFLISKWYKRTEQAQRTALLSCGSLISNAFGSVISAGILDVMEDMGGYAAWRWLFFIEGGLTIAVALWAMTILPDFPESKSTSRWLSPVEQSLAIRRIKEDTGLQTQAQISLGPSATEAQMEVGRESDAESRTSKPGLNQQIGLKLALSDKKVWWLAGTLTLLVASLSFNQYFPTLMETLGYDTTKTLLLCVPPWAFAAGVALFLSRHSDRHAERFWHISASLGFGILGFWIGILTMNTVFRYIALCLIAQSYAGFICFLAWASGSIGNPSAKRAVALALINTISTSGNVLGSYFYPTSFGPSYSYSFAICIVASSLSVLSCWRFRRHLESLNEKAEREEAERGEDGVRGWRYML